MSNANEPGSVDGIKEGLAKLASATPETGQPEAAPEVAVTPPGRWDRAKRITKLSLLGIGGAGCLSFCAVAGIFLSNPTIRHIAQKMIWHVDRTITWGGVDPTLVYNLADNFPPEKRKSITLLVLGSDHDSVGKRLADGSAIPIDLPNMPGRSDAIMLARFEFDGDSVSSLNVLSIPRDTRVRVPGHGVHKINAAHAYGGPELSCATVRDVFGIDPDYYVDLNFEGFQQVVDAVGGVDVNVHQQLDYDDNWGKLHIHLKPGQQRLNGYKAMGYVRFRHTDNDLARAERQHEFLEALRTKITDRKNFLCLPNVVGAVTNNLHSNLTMDQMLTLANLARKAPKDAICLNTLPVIEGKTFVYIDRRKSADIVRKMFFKEQQAAYRDIKTPDEAVISTHRRKRRVRETAPTHGSTQHAAPADTGDQTTVPKSDTNPEAGDAAPTPAPPAPDKSGAAEGQDKPEQPPAGSKSDNGSGQDGGKSKPKEGTGTTSGSTSAILRG